MVGNLLQVLLMLRMSSVEMRWSVAVSLSDDYSIVIVFDVCDIAEGVC